MPAPWAETPKGNKRTHAHIQVARQHLRIKIDSVFNNSGIQADASDFYLSRSGRAAWTPDRQYEQKKSANANPEGPTGGGLEIGCTQFRQ